MPVSSIQLQALPPPHSVGDTLDLAERCMLLDIVMALDRKGPGYLETLYGGSDAGLGFGSLGEQIKGKVNWDPAMHLANGFYDRQVAAMRQKDRAARMKHGFEDNQAYASEV